MVQQLRICLAVQGTLVQSLVWDVPTCHRATKPMCLETALATREATTMRSRALQLESSPYLP